MEPILRAASIYAFLLIAFRVTGKRSLAQITTFDLILLMIISEATQNAMLGEDSSITNAALVITTLILCDLAISWLTRRSSKLEKWVDDVPLIIVEDGKPLEERMRKARIREDDVMASARLAQGLERMDQIRFAVLERSGEISIIPKGGAS